MQDGKMFETATFPPSPPVPPTRKADGQRAGYLEVMFGIDAGKRFALGNASVVVGRGAEADFVLDDSTISRKHLRLDPSEGGFRLLDLGGINATMVGGTRVSEADLTDGSTIELGSSVLVLRIGAAPPDSGAEAPLRLRDTQEMPKLEGRQPGLNGGSPSPSGTGTGRNGAPPQERLRRVTSRRSAAVSPVIGRLLSWLVVICVVSVGALLLLKIVESSTGSLTAGLPAEEQIAAEKAAPKARMARQPRRPALEAPSGEGSATPSKVDVALQRFNAALEAEQAGRLQEAMDLLAEVSGKYPDFLPPQGPSLPEKMDQIRKVQKCETTLSEARAELAKPTPDRARIEELLLRLAAIPTSDGQYGEAAALLTDKARLKLKQLDLGLLPEPPQEGADGPAALPAHPDGKTGPSAPPAAPDPAAPTSSSGDVESKARGLYKRKEFDKAAEALRAAAKESSGEEAESLADMAEKVEKAGRGIEKALDLVEENGNEEDTLEALVAAERADEQAYEAFGPQLAQARAGLQVRLASRYLEAGKFDKARKALDEAAEDGSSPDKVAQLRNMFSFRAAALLKEARAEKTPAAAVRRLDSAIALSEPDSAVVREAEQLRATLESTAPEEPQPEE
jgi:tetratricopeptide (TPR) repeat protein